MKTILKRIVVASLLILLASLFACARDSRDTRPVAAPVPEPTIIAIRQVGPPASDDKTPVPYTKSKKKVATKKSTSAKKSGARGKSGSTPAGDKRPPDCPKCPETGGEKGAETGADKTAPMSNPVLDALSKELSLALDANKTAGQDAAPKKE